MSKHTAKFDFFGDEYEVQWDGNVWVSPCNGAQWSTIGEAVRSELDHAIRAGGDDPEDLEDAIQAAIDEAAEDAPIEVREYMQDGVVYLCVGTPDTDEDDAKAAALASLGEGRYLDEMERVDGYCTWSVIIDTYLYDSDTGDRLDAADLGITGAEYADAIRESLACDQAEGHIYVGQWRVYAA